MITIVTNRLDDTLSSKKLNTSYLKRIVKSKKGIYIDVSKDFKNPLNTRLIRELESKIHALSMTNSELSHKIKKIDDAISKAEQRIKQGNSGNLINQFDKMEMNRIELLDIINRNNASISEMKEHIDKLRLSLKTPEEILEMVNKRMYDKLMKSNYNSAQVQSKTTLVKGLTDTIKHMEELKKKYNIKMDNIIPGISENIALYPVRTFYETVDDYDKQKIAKLLRKIEELKISNKKLLARIKEKSKIIKDLERNIKKSEKLLYKAKLKIEKLLPESSLVIDRLRTLPKRRAISGYDELNKGKQVSFSRNAKVCVERNDELEALNKRMDDVLASQSRIQLEISKNNDLIEEYNNELNRIIPGASSLHLSSIKSHAPYQVKLEDVYPELPKDIYLELSRIIRLRNDKELKIRDLHSKISRLGHEIAGHKVNIDYDFIYNAVDFANDVYRKVKMCKMPDHDTILWSLAYALYCSQKRVTCVDNSETIMNQREIYTFTESINIPNHNIYISLPHSRDYTYIPDPLPKGVKLIEVKP